ncbi:hypothetical protein BD311DRAFT_177590 [Dichomitus squalens]|uniref:Uncharacterized protein n=1 Tax=Dichomitus squalens TaxID=114155 RepID=A0A4Q9M770_9APHY|nr:hypothetical protein BD311DRAFT_177590 [Dichomitus squalens]
MILMYYPLSLRLGTGTQTRSELTCRGESQHPPYPSGPCASKRSSVLSTINHRCQTGAAFSQAPSRRKAEPESYVSPTTSVELSRLPRTLVLRLQSRYI